MEFIEKKELVAIMTEQRVSFATFLSMFRAAIEQIAYPRSESRSNLMYIRNLFSNLSQRMRTKVPITAVMLRDAETLMLVVTMSCCEGDKSILYWNEIS